MKSFLASLILLSCSLGFLSMPTYGEETSPKTFIIGSFPFPPLLHTSQTGEFSGTLGETVKAMCEAAGLNCLFEVYPLARAYQYLKIGKVDALITLNLGQFKDCCTPSNWSTPWAAGFFSRNRNQEIPTSPKEVLGHDLIIVNGMRSPYQFMPELDQWANDNKIGLFKAKDISTSVRMFNQGRATLLWGSQDFLWHFEKLGFAEPVTFTPRVERPVVVWVNNHHDDFLNALNQGYARLQEQHMLNDSGILIDEIMSKRYQDSPFPPPAE